MGYWISVDCDSDGDSDDLVYFRLAYIPYIFIFSTFHLLVKPIRKKQHMS